MPIAVNRRRLWDYVLEAERARPADDGTRKRRHKPTTFKLRTLTPEQLAEVKQRLKAYFTPAPEATDEDGNPLGPRYEFRDALEVDLPALVRDLKAICAVGVGGWEHFNDEDGKPVEFRVDEDGLAAGELLDMLSDDDMQELALAVLRQNVLTETERGK